MRTSEWKYIEYLADDTAELYNLDSDPDEMMNLYPDFEYEGIITELRSELEEWWFSTGGDTDAWTSGPTLDFKMPDSDSLEAE